MKQIVLSSFCLLTVCGALYYFSFGTERGEAGNLSNAAPTPSISPPVKINPHNAVGPGQTGNDAGQIDSPQPSKKKDIKFDRQISREIYEQAGKLARQSKLADLKNSRLKDGDKEIRIWNIPDLFTSRTKGYIFKSIGGKWKGMFIVDKKLDQHFEEINFDAPSSGWEKWEIFINDELSPAKIANDSSPVGMDGLLVVIEVKFSRDYAKNIFWGPSSHKTLLNNTYGEIRKEFFSDKLNWKDY